MAQNDIVELKKQGAANYANAITLIEQRCKKRGDTLVLRDWAHLDYTGFPFVPTPGYSPLLYPELAESFDIIRISTTRSRYPVAEPDTTGRDTRTASSGVSGLDQFLIDYRKYAELCVETGFICYEDFLRKPELAMHKLCEHLQIKFDPGFINKWHDYKTIAGDINSPRSSDKIKMPPKRPVEPELRKKFLANADYHRACELLGYDPLEK